MFSSVGHFKNFEKVRHSHNEGPCNETNKLVLKLDKLLEAPNTSVVEWAPNNEVKLCPYCAKAFNVSRRRHHCRTCGAILCNSCSRFLDRKDADRLVRPRELTDDSVDDIALDQSSTSSTPNDKDSKDTKDNKIRLCEDCDKLLKRRLQTIEDHYYRPKFCEHYDEMREKIREIDGLVAVYESMCESLHCGDEVYKLSDAVELKAKIDNLKDTILPLTKRMFSVADHNSYTVKQVLTCVNESVVHWLRTRMISLPPVPSENDYEKLKAKRRQQLLSDKQYFDNNSTPSAASKRRSAHASRQTNDLEPSGWVPETPVINSALGNGDDDDDEDSNNPLAIQIRMLDEYIRQARLANRYDEVSSLEASKRDLEIELSMRKLAMTN